MVPSFNIAPITESPATGKKRGAAEGGAGGGPKTPKRVKCSSGLLGRDQWT